MRIVYIVHQFYPEFASGTERVADMAYQLNGPTGLGNGDLPYEHRMLERWFRERFAGKP